MERSKLERETIILFNEAEPDAEVYTHNGKLQKRILELCDRTRQVCCGAAARMA